MKFNVERDTLLKPLQAVLGVVERRHALPILANVCLSIRNEALSVAATDMELELIADATLAGATDGEITVPARKLVDICRSLPAGANVEGQLEGDRMLIRSGRSRFNLTTLPAADYPSFDPPVVEATVSLKQGELKRLIELTHFAMAQQDVRYYLNGLLFDLSKGQVRAVATDGHRLAIADVDIGDEGPEEARSIIVPRKGIMELSRLLSASDESLELSISANQIQISLPGLRFTSKLIEGKFPDYERVIPQADQCDKQIVLDREVLKQSLARASILSNDKYRAIRLSLETGVLRLMANNPEQEEAEDEVEVDYDGDKLEIGFNVAYLIDALGALPSDSARVHLTDESSSCLITPEGSQEACQYVVMPMRL